MNGLCDLCQAPATVGAFCTACLERLKYAVHDTPGLLKDLDVTTTKQAKQAPPSPGGGETSLVFNIQASEIATELTAALRALAWAANPHRRIYDAPPAALAYEVFVAPEKVARDPQAGELAERFYEARRRADRARDIPEERFTYGKCDCGRTLTAPRSKESTTCPECGSRWDLTEWRETKVSEARARVPDFVGTIKDVLMVLEIAGHEVKRGNVDRWVYEGKLSPCGEGRKFRAGDVAECANVSLT